MTLSPDDLLGGYTLVELEAAFALVAPASNWKLPINATLPAKTTPTELKKVAFAVMFYTGGTASITGPLSLGKPNYLVTAPGYYNSVGA